MRRTPGALAALILAVAWYVGVAPAALDALVGLRDPAALAASGSTSAADSLAPTEWERAEDARLHRISEDWAPRAAALLSPEQRVLGQRLAAELPERPPAPSRLLSVEGDLWALSRALIARHGAQLADLPPPAPATDPWGTLSRRERVQALLALIRADALRPDQAEALLALSLDAMQAQAARVDLEEGRRAGPEG